MEKNKKTVCFVVLTNLDGLLSVIRLEETDKVDEYLKSRGYNQSGNSNTWTNEEGTIGHVFIQECKNRAKTGWVIVYFEGEKMIKVSGCYSKYSEIPDKLERKKFHLLGGHYWSKKGNNGPIRALMLQLSVK